MNLNLIKIVGVTVGVAGMTVETRAAEMQEYVAERDNTQVSVWKSHRPEKRLFTSKAVEEQIQRAKKLLTNTKLAWMFENCFPTTPSCTRVISMPCGCGIPVRKCGPTYSWPMRILN